MASYGNLSLSELIVYNSAGDASANLTFDTNNSDGNFAMNTGLDINGNLDVTGSTSINNHFTLSNEGSYSVLSITPGSIASSTLLGVSTSLQIGSNTSGTGCYLQIQNGDVSGNLSINATDGNFYMNTGLDVSGNLVFTQSVDGSIQQYNSIQLNGGNGSFLSFPYNNNGGTSSQAFTSYALYNYSPSGLGITWSYTGNGETDLIGYGGGNAGAGGITIYSHNTNANGTGTQEDVSTRIADFWPNGSTIYNNLTLGKNLTLGTNNSLYFKTASPTYTCGTYLNNTIMTNCWSISGFGTTANNIIDLPTSTATLFIVYIYNTNTSAYVDSGIFYWKNGLTTQVGALVALNATYFTLNLSGSSPYVMQLYTNQTTTNYTVYVYSMGQMYAVT